MTEDIEKLKEEFAEIKARVELASKKAGELATLRDSENFDYDSSLAGLVEVYGSEIVGRELAQIRRSRSLEGLENLVKKYGNLRGALVSRIDPQLKRKLIAVREGLKRSDGQTSGHYLLFAENSRDLNGIKLPYFRKSKNLETKIASNGYTIVAGIFWGSGYEGGESNRSLFIDRIISFLVVPLNCSYRRKSVDKNFNVPYLSKGVGIDYYGNLFSDRVDMDIREHNQLLFKKAPYRSHQLKQYLRQLIDEGYAEFVYVLIDEINNMSALAASHIERRNSELAGLTR